MSIKVIKNIYIQSAVIDSDEKQNTMSVFPIMELQPTVGQGKNSTFSNIRVRAVVRYGS